MIIGIKETAAKLRKAKNEMIYFTKLESMRREGIYSRNGECR